MGLNKVKIGAWSLYELAETAAHALYFTFFWPLYISEHLGGNEFHIGLTASLSLLAAALIVPYIGAFSDAWGRRMPIIVVSTVLTAAAIALTGYTHLLGALFLGFLARLLLTLDDDLYSAKLVDVAPKKYLGRISGMGIGVGYFGTIAALMIAYPILNALGWETLAATQAMFWQAAVMMIIFSIPLFFLVKDPPRNVKSDNFSFTKYSKTAWSELKKTALAFKEFRALPRFLLASFVYNDAAHTTLIFLVLFARAVIGVTIQQFFFAFAIMAVFSAVGSFVFGRLSDSIGPKKSLNLALIGWIFVIVYLLFDPTFTDLIIAGSIGGAMLGGTWTMNRHMVTRLSPYHKLGEIFGIEGFTRRAAGVIGPAVFGAIVVQLGYHAALYVIIFLFVLGLILLQLVPDKEVEIT